MPPPSQHSSHLLLTTATLVGLAAAALALTPAGRAWALRVWEGDREGARQRKAMKKLAYLESALAKLAAQIEACGRRLDAVEAAGRGAPEDGGKEEEDEEGKPVSAYYHFDSSGRKFANKWDSYDVDGELARLDAAEEHPHGSSEEGARGASSQERTGNHQRGKGKVTLGRVRTEVGQLNHDLERLMGYLDQVRGDEAVKVRRKALVQASHAVFGSLDALTQRLMG